MTCHAIVWVFIAQAGVLYPGGFEMIEGVSKEEVTNISLSVKSRLVPPLLDNKPKNDKTEGPRVH